LLCKLAGRYKDATKPENKKRNKKGKWRGIASFKTRSLA
jgi:hypothetical protein